MKFMSYLSLVSFLVCPQVLLAAGSVEHKYAPKGQIKFSPTTMVAFDRSGSKVTHRTMADGSQSADYKGTMGSVTVARMGADGNIETFCTTSEVAARAWMAGEDGARTAKVLNVPVMVK